MIRCGNDFLSPALEEADLMWRILPDAAYQRWLRKFLPAIANRHLREALPNVASGDYMGEHWLASFAVYALTMQPSVID